MRDNPFMYLTPRKKDFEGEQGEKVLYAFKKVFYKAYKKYSSILDKIVPEDAKKKMGPQPSITEVVNEEEEVR